MKLRFLKPHIQFAAGEEVEVTDERGRYFIRMGVAEEFSTTKEKKEKQSVKEKKEKQSNGIDKN